MKKHLKDNSIFASNYFMEQNSDLFKFLERKDPTEYDKIMDAVYNKTHIGGGTHRHFDESHTLHSSWDKISDKTGDVEIFDFLKAHANELVTPEGIPLLDLNYDNHQVLGHEISEILGDTVSPGAIKNYLRDHNSLNAPELFGAALGSVFQFMAIKSGDPRAISRVTAANLSLGLLTGNPLQISLGLVGLGHGIYKGKIQSFEQLRGAVPVVSGALAFQVSKKVLGLGPNTSLLVSIATSIGTNIIMDKISEAKLKKAQEELGNDQKYLLVMTPDGLKKELMVFELKNGSKIDLAI